MKTARDKETDECASKWEENVEDGVSVASLPARPDIEGANSLAGDLLSVYHATGDAVFLDAFGKLFEYGLGGKDYRHAVTRMARSRWLSPSEATVAAAVDLELVDGCPSKLAAYERVAARLGVRSESFDGAVKIVQRTFEKARKQRGPGPILPDTA